MLIFSLSWLFMRTEVIFFSDYNKSTSSAEEFPGFEFESISLGNAIFYIFVLVMMILLKRVLANVFLKNELYQYFYD